MVHVSWAILIACGKSEQIAGGAELAFLSIGDSPMLAYSLMAFERCADIDGVIVVANKEKLDVVANTVRLFGCSKVQKIVGGTTQRQSSLANGLKALDPSVTLIVVHDVSRPCVSHVLIEDTVKAAKRYGSGVAAARVVDPIKEVEKGQKVTKDLDQSKLWATQTPQTFKRDVLEKALAAAAKRKRAPDDEAGAVFALQKDVHLVPSSSSNIRVQSMDDILLAASLLRVH